MDYLDRVSICCSTEEKARLLLSHLAILGYRWASGSNPCKFTYWQDWRQDTVYHLSNGTIKYSNACNPDYRLVDLCEVLSIYPNMSPDEFYKYILVTESGEIDGVS